MTKNNITTKKQTSWLKFKQNSARTYEYVKLQTKLSFVSNKIEKPWKKVVKYVLASLVFALFLYVAFLILNSLSKRSDLIPGSSFSIILFTIAQVVILIVSISKQCQRLRNPTDFSIISTFPLTTFQRYIGEIIAIYLKIAVYSLILFYPLLLVYGGAVGFISPEVSAGANCTFVFCALFATILMPLLPFAISLILAIPFVYLSNFLQNKNIAKIIIFLIIFVGILIVYSLLLRLMADLYIHSTTSVEVMKAIASFLNSMNQPYNFCFFNSEICLARNVGANFGILIAMTIGFGAVGILITKPLYNKFSTSAIVLSNNNHIHSIKFQSSNPYLAIFVKEIRQIIRTQTYAYFYFAVALSMPLLTYLISDIVRALGQAQVGSDAFFGFALLILCVIVSLIGSFSANIISREGNQFYITKTIPLSYRKQLLIKSLVNFIVGFVGLLLCIIVLGATSTTADGANATLTPAGLGILFVISTFFLIGITFNGININLVRPNVEIINGQPNESNIVIQLAIALIISAIVSVMIIVLGAIFKQAALGMQLGVMGFMIAYALLNFLIFFFTAEKKYSRIEVR